MLTVERSGTWDLEGLSRGMRDGMRAAGRELAALVKREQVAAGRAAGAPRRFAGYPIGVNVRTFARADSFDVYVGASPPGFWSMLETGRRGGYTVKPRRKRAVTPPAGPSASATVKRSVPGRHVWTRATDAVMPVVERELAAVMDSFMDPG